MDNILAHTPDGSWDPQNAAYKENEKSMVDWKGNIIEGGNKTQNYVERYWGWSDHDIFSADIIGWNGFYC